jgi:hypothetical protein
MRMLVDFHMPLEPFNSMMREGTAGRVIQQILDDLKPEAVYFTTREGKRGGTMVIDVPDPSEIPAIAGSLFMRFQASISFYPCMTPDDLAKSDLKELGRKYA